VLGFWGRHERWCWSRGPSALQTPNVASPVNTNRCTAYYDHTMSTFTTPLSDPTQQLTTGLTSEGAARANQRHGCRSIHHLSHRQGGNALHVQAIGTICSSVFSYLSYRFQQFLAASILVVGAEKPTDFDEHMSNIPLYERRGEVAPPISAKLMGMAQACLGEAWTPDLGLSRRWEQGGGLFDLRNYRHLNWIATPT